MMSLKTITWALTIIKMNKRYTLTRRVLRSLRASNNSQFLHILISPLLVDASKQSLVNQLIIFRTDTNQYTGLPIRNKIRKLVSKFIDNFYNKF